MFSLSIALDTSLFTAKDTFYFDYSTSLHTETHEAICFSLTNLKSKQSIYLHAGRLATDSLKDPFIDLQPVLNTDKAQVQRAKHAKERATTQMLAEVWKMEFVQSHCFCRLRDGL